MVHCTPWNIALDRRGDEAASNTSQTREQRCFSIFRSFFWEHAREELNHLQNSKDPEDFGKARALATLVSEPLRVDIIVLPSLLPFDTLSQFKQLCESATGGTLPDFRIELKELLHEFGNELVS
jgi:hypothetical protein